MKFYIPPPPMPIRYSPKPLESYSRKNPQGKWLGPAASKFFVGDLEAWNLAFLSHPFEKSLYHTDPKFTVIVGQSVRTRMDDGTTGRIHTGYDDRPDAPTIRSLLQRPAEVFVKLMLEDPDLRSLTPLYQAYGEAWMTTIQERAALCGQHIVPATSGVSAAEAFIESKLWGESPPRT